MASKTDMRSRNTVLPAIVPPILRKRLQGWDRTIKADHVYSGGVGVVERLFILHRTLN